MTVTAQTIRGSDATVSKVLVSASFGDVLGYEQGGGGFVFATGVPTGDLTPPAAGWEYTNVGTGLKYVSTGTTSADWELLISSESLANTPTVAGATLAFGGKQYIAAYHLLSVAATPYQINYTDTAGQEYTAVAPATLAFPQRIAVPVVGGTVGLQWFQIGGLISALVDGTADVASGDFVRVINAGTAFIVSGGTATVQAIDDSAMAQAAQATDSAVAISVLLLNNWVTVAAS